MWNNWVVGIILLGYLALLLWLVFSGKVPNDGK